MLFLGNQLRDLLSSSVVFLTRLAACLAGLLLLHSPVWAQAMPGVETAEPSLIAAQSDTYVAPGIRGEGWVVVDASGTLTVEQIHARFEAGEGQPLNAGQIMPTGSGRALWYRLKLPLVTSPMHLMLSVPHPSMDSVDLYRPATQAAGDGRWQLQRSGDRIPVAAWPVRHLYPAFELVLLPGESQPSYLRVVHNYPISVHWMLLDVSRFQEKSKQLHLLLGVYIGLVLLIALISTVHAVSWRDSIHFFYAGYVLVVALGQLSLTGLGGEYFWPGTAWWNDLAPAVLTLANAALLHLFLRQLVMDRDVSWLSHWLLLMSALGGVIALSLVMGEHRRFFSFLAPYYLTSLATYLGVAGWYVWRRPRVGWWVLAATTCLVGGAIFPILRTLSLLPLSMATQYGEQVGAAFQIPLLLIALYFRSRERRDNQTRVGALTRVDPLSGVASHRVLLQRLEQLTLRQQRHPGAGAVMRIRLSNANEIRHDYGMEVAQNAVVHAGACITGVAQEGDTVARHRDGDFVLILQGHLTHEQLADIGQRLIVRGLAESPGLPPNMALKFKLAVAEAPFRAADATSLLESLGAVLGELAGRSGTALRFVTRPDAKGALLA